MDVKCPHCGTEYEVEQKDMYRHTECEVCGKGFVIGATLGQVQDGERVSANVSREGTVSGKVKDAANADAGAAIQKVHDVDRRRQGERAKSITKKVVTPKAGAIKRQQDVTHKHKGQHICTRCGSVSEKPGVANNIGCLVMIIPIAMLAVGWFIGGILRFINRMSGGGYETFDEKVQAYFTLSFLAMICVEIADLLLNKIQTRCPRCNYTNCLVDLESPVGKKLFKELHAEKHAE